MQELAFAPFPDTNLGTLAAAVRRRLKQVVGARLVPYDLSPQQFWVMLVLLEKGPSSLHPLAQQVWMDDPTASRMVKAMVGRGWLTARPDPRHGRRILIDLSPSARPMAEELQTMAMEIRAAMVAGLSSQEQAALQRGLHTMVGNLEAMLSLLPDQGATGAETVAS